MNLLNDIYYRPDYARLYVRSGESLFTFEYRDGNAVFFNLSIKRPITYIGLESCDETWFDLETPYGYGGFYTNSDDAGFVEAALEKYRQRCREERIIAEFIRFHPFNPFPTRFPDLFDLLVEDREVVVVDLKQSTEERWSQYGATTRNILRKCAKKLLFQSTTDLDTFEDLYAQTMVKNDADDFYYFDRRYYDALLATEGVQLYQVSFEERIVAMAFFMRGEGVAHYHLSANDTDFLKLNGNYFMLDQAFEEARRVGMNTFLLGGGRSPDPQDSLLRFKKKFSRETKLFHIAGLVYNAPKYQEYIARWEKLNPDNKMRYFLKYRLKGI